MEKKIYTTPVLSVVEFKMSQVICTSIVVDGGESGITGGGSDENYDGPVRANNRGGIWDED